MKKILIFLAILSMTFTALAQNKSQIAEILSKTEGNRVSLNYSCTLKGSAPIQLEGTLVIQGTCFLAKGNGMEVYCDGNDRWTVDPEAREVYIEKAESVEELLKHTDEISDLKLSSVKYSSPGDAAIFSFDTKRLDSSWVVTDLRN